MNITCSPSASPSPLIILNHTRTLHSHAQHCPPPYVHPLTRPPTRALTHSLTLTLATEAGDPSRLFVGIADASDGGADAGDGTDIADASDGGADDGDGAADAIGIAGAAGVWVMLDTCPEVGKYGDDDCVDGDENDFASGGDDDSGDASGGDDDCVFDNDGENGWWVACRTAWAMDFVSKKIVYQSNSKKDRKIEIVWV